MRVVIFWAMCHHSLGHEKKALLSVSVVPIFPYDAREWLHLETFFSDQKIREK